MATPGYYPEWEAKEKRAKELIAAGGTHAIQCWSRTDAERLCPKEFMKFIELDGPMLNSEWVEAAKRAIELIQEGIDILDRK